MIDSIWGKLCLKRIFRKTLFKFLNSILICNYLFKITFLIKSATKTVKSIIKDAIAVLQKDLHIHSNTKNKEIMEKYMKNVSIYRGIKNANLRALIFKDFWALKVKPLDPKT